ncbi:MAG TPA: S8 family peptidase [Luteitalea sp.]|nr:S8 family peptidase [Luteitalea sp.]
MSASLGTTRVPLGACVLALVALALSLPVSTQERPASRGRAYVAGALAAAGEVLIKYRGNAMHVARARVQADGDVESEEGLGRSGVRRLRSRHFDTAALIDRLRDDPDIEFVEPNFVVHPTATPNDPQFAGLWGLLNTGSNTVGGGGTAGLDIDVTSAWDTTTGSRAQVVGVIDTGVDYSHPDLAANMWSAPASFTVTIGGQSISCAAGTHGFDAINKTCTPTDSGFHGTHVAGTIGAIGNNGVGVTGVNWVASMMALKFLGPSGGLTSDAIAAIEFAIQAKAIFGTATTNVRVLNNSWGGSGYSSALVSAIASADAADMLFVAAAGNDAANIEATPFYPAAYTNPNVLTVASTTNTDGLSSFSNYGATKVHVAAPGSAILSTYPGNQYQVLQGTSMAAPHVAGAAMLALSGCSATTAQLRALLVDSVDYAAALSGKVSTSGRLNVQRAMQACNQPRVSGMTLMPDVSAPRAPGTTVTWTAAATGGSAPYQYQFVVFDGSTWQDAGPWSSASTFAWTPSTANANYQIAVRARSAWNTGAREFAVSQAFAIRPMVTGLTLTPGLPSPQPSGTAVTWTAAATGGQAPYQYQFVLFDGSTWVDAGPWSTSATWTWTPSSANASHQVAVRARSAGNSGAREMAVSQAFVVKPRVTAIALTPSVAAPQAPGATVTWTAVASGGEGPYQYQYVLFNGSTWVDVGPWTTTNTLAWTPAVANAGYQIAVRARGAWHTGARELAVSQAFPVMPLVSGLTLTPSLAAPQGIGTSVTFTAAATGGQAPYQYQFVRFDGTTWQDVTPWQSSSTWTWTPSSASPNAQVAVRVRGSWNTGAREMAVGIPYPIAGPITALALVSDVTSPRAANSTITWTATASGGHGPYQYQFVIFNGSVWQDAGPWSTTPTLAWTPGTANPNYQVAVRARGTWNSGPREMAVSQAFPITP